MRLFVGPERIGEPMALHYSDAQLAAEPSNIGYLVGRAMEERAVILKPKTHRRRG